MSVAGASGLAQRRARTARERGRAAELCQSNVLHALAERLRSEAIKAGVGVQVFENLLARRQKELEGRQDRLTEQQAGESHRALLLKLRDPRA